MVSVPGGRGSIPGQVIFSLLNSQHYKLWNKSKWSHPEKRVVPSPTPQCSSYWKGALGCTRLRSTNLTFTFILSLFSHFLNPLVFCFLVSLNFFSFLILSHFLRWNVFLFSLVIQILTAQSAGSRRIQTTSLQSCNTPPQRMTLNQMMVRLQSWSLGNIEYPFIAISPRSSQNRVVILVRIPFMSQIGLFNHLLSSSRRATSTDFPDPLLSLVAVVHHSR